MFIFRRNKQILQISWTYSIKTKRFFLWGGGGGRGGGERDWGRYSSTQVRFDRSQSNYVQKTPWTLQIFRTAIQNMIHLRFRDTFHSTLHSRLLVSQGNDVAQYFMEVRESEGRTSTRPWSSKEPYQKICCNAYRFEFFWLNSFVCKGYIKLKELLKCHLVSGT